MSAVNSRAPPVELASPAGGEGSREGEMRIDFDTTNMEE